MGAAGNDLIRSAEDTGVRQARRENNSRSATSSKGSSKARSIAAPSNRVSGANMHVSCRDSSATMSVRAQVVGLSVADPACVVHQLDELDVGGGLDSRCPLRQFVIEVQTAVVGRQKR
ncbi:hypothetical protein GCM10009557_22940 [Virgisporangium ochraceum]|uniref:Uncharacterized protein n=1 Tax=Virgisporangium ochraceum TaxID=65505 RepID=A0A8J4A587_9ACTN|nr:hypothetical protein Voc01_100550 [Virgisporangium ochraceum]